MNKKKSKNKNLFLIILIFVIILISIFFIISKTINNTGDVKKVISQTQDKDETKVPIDISELPLETVNQNSNFATQLNPLNRELTVDEINQINKNNGLMWQAKENKFTKMTLEKKKKVLGINFTDEEKQAASKRIKELQDKINSGEINTIGSDTKISKENSKNISNINEYPGTPDITTNTPISFDWRNVNGQNYITEVKDQGECGSCWAFATLGGLEGQYNTYFNNPQINLDLSEQQLISDFNPYGCNGLYNSEFINLFNYINNLGIYTESYWPYIACDAQNNINCQYYNSIVPGAPNNTYKTTEFESISFGNIAKIKEALVNKGPVLTGMLVFYDFFNYSNGVYQSDISTGIAGGHAVLIVGYGNYDGIDYWIVKNSWGSEWGEDGYFRIKIGDASGLENRFLYVLTTPILDGTQTSCTDQDQDNYCYWGTYSDELPNFCSSNCLPIKDCDDSNPNNNINCNSESTLGRLNITSTPNNSKVYVKDQISNDWIYRGRTPLIFNLNSGLREIKIEDVGYYPQEQTININSGEITNLQIDLEQNDEEYLEGWPVYLNGDYSYSGISSGDLDNDGEQEIVFGTSSCQRYSNINCGVCKIYVINKQGDIKNGFPVSVNCINEDSQFGFNDWTPAITDLDNDGQKEIIAYGVQNNPGRFLLYNISANGQINWIKYFQNLDISYRGGAIVEDIDGDGYKEIILTFQSQLYVLDYLGNIKQGWPHQVYQESILISGKPAIIDFNSSDNQKEIVIAVDPFYMGGENTYVRTMVFNPDGSQWQGYPQTIYFNLYPGYSPVLTAGDIYRNDEQKIILKYKNKLFIYNKLGAIELETTQNEWNGLNIQIINAKDILMSSWMWYNSQDNSLWEDFLIKRYNDVGGLVQTTSILGQFVVTGDIDNDKEVDIIGGSGVDLFAQNLENQNIAGYPKENIPLLNVPLLIDLDNDGNTDVVVSTKDGYIYAFKTNSDYDPRYMDWPMYGHDPQHTNNYNMPYCSDGTWNMKCSSTELGKSCAFGELVPDCQKCGGCSSHQVCADNGDCVAPEIIQ
jgi:C1A family cysteine protease